MGIKMIVMRFTKLDKSYLAVEETRAGAKSNLNWICAYLKIDPDGVEDGHSAEAVLLDNKVVGSTSSVAFGHTHGNILAFAYIKPQAAKPATQLKVVIVGIPRPVRVLEEAVYDPESLLPRK
jgi:dimethylglycine dehydrogenase